MMYPIWFAELLGRTQFSFGLRKDKYNKKLFKYYVEVDEEDEDEGIEEEREKEEHSMDVTLSALKHALSNPYECARFTSRLQI